MKAIGLALLCLLGCAEAQEMDLQTRRGIERWVLNHQQVEMQKVEGQRLGKLEISQDPYKENAWEISAEALQPFAGAKATIEVEFLDAGAGVIAPQVHTSAATLSPSRQCNYTRCNTGTQRRAAFEFAMPAELSSPRLSITGLQYPLRIRLLPAQGEDYWQELARARPTVVRPLVQLQRPMRLVTTAGIDVTGGMDTLDESLEQIAELAPLAKALGMTSIEGYVTWKRLEPEREGDFDFRFYDAIVNRLADYGLQFFPLLIVGSAYALPDWFIASEENKGFVCLEHGLENPVQSIWCPTHRRHVERVLKAFGDHYGPTGRLEAVRLGPSGNYGESQYPAGGNWGARGKAMHIHIGWWAGDAFARAEFQRWLREKYGSIAALNTAWDSGYGAFEEVQPQLPETMLSPRQRLDFTQWYTDSMSDWCAWWGRVTRAALPGTPIYQSAGGWGFREAGTEYSVQARGMAPIGAGIRLTNETDSYEQNVYATRLAATAAKAYGIPLGYEPASSHTARGVAGRIFNTLATNGDHLFTYHSNLMNSQLAIEKWVQYIPLFDLRREPLVEVAVYYPETASQLDDAAFRHLYAWGFNPRAAAVRRVVDADYLDDQLIRDGLLDRYKVLVCVWGDMVEKEVQETIDAWLRMGGTLIYHNYPRGPMKSPEGDTTFFTKWQSGDCGAGKFLRFKGDMEPPEIFSGFLREALPQVEGLSATTRECIQAEHPSQVYLSAQEGGRTLALNYNPEAVTVRLAGGTRMKVPAYGIAITK